MASEILMPRLGWTMEEGVLGGWLKQDGEAVQIGEMLFTVEGDKATQEVEAFDTGILRIPPNAPKPGDTILVGALLAYITRPGEAAPFEEKTENGKGKTEKGQQSTTNGQQSTANAQAAPSTIHHRSTEDFGELRLQRAQSSRRAAHERPPSTNHHSPAISPRARRVARELGLDWSQVAGSGRTGRIVERDVRAAAQTVATQRQMIEQPAAVPPVESRLRISPIAQRMAQEAGIDLSELARQKGIDKIERSDVEAAIQSLNRSTEDFGEASSELSRTLSRAAHERLSISQSPNLPISQSQTIPTTRIRRLIAQRMSESAHTTVPVTLTTEADASELVALREQMKTAFAARGWLVPSYNDLLVKLTATALQEHPLLNAVWGENEITLSNEVHIGLAVDHEEGLLVPVIRNAQAKSLRQIAAESRTLIEKAQTRKLSPDEMQGGTFTITNLGMYNIDAFTPIINLPQCAILGVGRIVKKPAVVNDQVVPRHMLALSLTFDHRVVDGAPAARFLDLLREFVERPTLWVVG